jgi:lipopolysaccharide transport system permease protein
VLPFLIQLWLFASSVILPSSALPASWRRALLLNPLTGIIEGYRSALFGLPFDWPALGLASIITLVVLVYAAFSFHRMEKHFADIM